MLPSSTVENYLKAIYLGVSAASPANGLLAMGQLAAALSVAPGTATTMVKALAESGLVRYEPYAGVTLTEKLINEIKARVRIGASPRHVPAKIIAVTDIPRTKSGKIVELAVRDVVHGRPVKNKEALANPEALALFSGLEELQS